MRSYERHRKEQGYVAVKAATWRRVDGILEEAEWRGTHKEIWSDWYSSQTSSMSLSIPSESFLSQKMKVLLLALYLWNTEWGDPWLLIGGNGTTLPGYKKQIRRRRRKHCDKESDEPYDVKAHLWRRCGLCLNCVTKTGGRCLQVISEDNLLLCLLRYKWLQPWGRSERLEREQEIQSLKCLNSVRCRMRVREQRRRFKSLGKSETKRQRTFNKRSRSCTSSKRRNRLP